MSIRGSSHAIARGRVLTAVAAVGALAVAGLGSGCGGWSGLSLELAGDAGRGQGTGEQGRVADANSHFNGDNTMDGSISTGGSWGASGAPAGVVTCTFGGLLVDEETLSSYTESGITVVATAGGWRARTGFGKPAPFISFATSPGVSETGRVKVTAGDLPFSFVSVDLYSSITPIPYVFTGLMGSTKVFSVSGTVPNTFGAFAAIANPNAGDLIDTLVIELTNGAACCENPMGLDNVQLIM